MFGFLYVIHSCCWMEVRNDAYCDNKSDDSDNSNKKTVANEIRSLHTKKR